MTEIDFQKKVLTGQEGPKSPKKSQKLGFLGFVQKSNSFMRSHFLLEYESTNGLLTFVSNKNLFLDL